MLELRSHTLKNWLALDLLRTWPCDVSAEKEFSSIPSIFMSVGGQLQEASERVWVTNNVWATGIVRPLGMGFIPVTSLIYLACQ